MYKRYDLGKGKLAVAIISLQGWEFNMPLGDDITQASIALVGRYATEEEAKAEAARLNDAQPAVMPGSQAVPVFAALKYVAGDYICSQDRRNGSRSCDRRIASGW